MAENNDTAAAKEPAQAAKAQPIGKMNVAEVDAEFSKIETLAKQLNELVKTALASSQPVGVETLRQLQKLTQRRSKLIIRRISLLMVAPTAPVIELLDKLMKAKAAN